MKLLDKSVVYEILNLTIKDIEKRLIDKRITISLTDVAKDEVIKESYDVRYGARGIKRFVSKNIESLIANALIMDSIKFGGHILIDYQNDKFIIK